MPLGTEVGLGPEDIVLDVDPAPLYKFTEFTDASMSPKMMLA